MSTRVIFFPANCGDSFLVECPVDGGVFRILIDGGISATADVISQYLTKDGPSLSIDLVVVSHIDNDHIGGIIKLMMDEEINGSIKEVWFNGLRHLGVPLPANIQSLSVRQGIDLEKVLEGDPRWNASVGGASISLNPDKSPKHIELARGVDVYILSPGATQLTELKRNWERIAAELERERKRKVKLPPGIQGLSAGKNVRALANSKFQEDKAYANGSSIAFLLKAGGKTLLFTGDAFPSVVVEAANKLPVGQMNAKGQIAVDVFKVSHHGSAGNTDKDIVKKFPASNYLISTDGTHEHPDDEAVARILEHSDPNQKKVLISNYPDTLLEWADVEFDGKWCAEVAPNDGQNGIVLDL